MREVTESAVWDVTVCKHRVFILQILRTYFSFQQTDIGYSFAQGNSYRERAIDCTQSLSALIVHILKMRLAGQNRLVS